MKIAVTGATGFIGGAAAAGLAAEGHDIFALARPSSNQKWATRNIEYGLNSFTWRTGDITDPANLRGKFEGVNWLIHAAGMLGQAGVPERNYFQLHEKGTANVLAEAERAGVSRIIHISSPGVLGPIEGEPADERAPLSPSNSYERSKAAAEEIALDFAGKGVPVIVVRPEFVYGPGDLHVLGLFKAVRDGRFFLIDHGRHICHPTFIEDVVNGISLALTMGHPGEIYHLTGPKPISFRQLGEVIAAALSVKPPRLNLPRWQAWTAAAGLEAVGKVTGWQPPLSRTGVAFFSEDRYFSWQKAKDVLGYIPSFDFSQGVAKTVSWYQKNKLL